MNVFELVGKLVLDGADKVQDELDKTRGSLQDFGKEMKIVGAAFTAIGAAGIKFSSDARKINADIGQTALTLGITTKELRDLEASISSVDSPMKEVVATFDYLARAGMRNTTEMKATASAFDTLADAIGLPADQVTEMLVPAFRAFGINLVDVGSNIDDFTWLVKNSTVDLSQFAMTVQRLAPAMQAAGISMDDAIIGLVAMENRGITGRAAISQLSAAIERSATSHKTLAEELGLTSDEIQKYNDELKGAIGISEKYADIANTQFGIMDKLKFEINKLTLSLGTLLEPFEPILGAMSSLGIVMIALSSKASIAGLQFVFAAGKMLLWGAAVTVYRGVAIAAAAAQWVLNGAVLAFNAITSVMSGPIGLAIAAIGLLIAIGVVLWKKWDQVVKFFKIAWAEMQLIFADAVQAILKYAIAPLLGGIHSVLDVVGKVVGFFKKDWGEAIQSAADSVTDVIDNIDKWTESVEANAKAYKDQAMAGSTPGTPQTAPEVALPHLGRGGLVTKPITARIGEVPEMVIPLNRLKYAASPVSSASSGDRAPIHLHLEVAGREVADYILTDLARNARLKGFRIR